MKDKKIRLKKFLIIFLIFILIIGGTVGIYFFTYSESETIVTNADIIETNTNVILNLMEEDEITEEEIDKYNCNYEIESGTNIVKIDTYTGTEDAFVIDEIIDDTYVTGLEIQADAFIESDNLEMIKVATSLADDIEELENFEVSETLSDEEYTVYVTTKTYTESYIAYTELTDEEKESVGAIPEKFEEVYGVVTEETASSLYLIDIDDIPESFDLREGNEDLGIDGIDVTVEDQHSTGICYAYGILTSVETYIFKQFGQDKDFSEIHLAVLSSQGSGGTFYKSWHNYFAKAYGPIDETYLDSETLYTKYTNGTCSTEEKLVYKFCLDDESLTETQLTTAQEYVTSLYTDDLEYYVMDYVAFTSFDGDDKSDSSNDDAIEENRNYIKLQIMEYGGVKISIDMLSSKYKTLNGYTTLYVSPNSKDSSIDHGVCIIGWDDNFPKENFLTSSTSEQPEEDGAFLAVNSWGDDWGAEEDGTFWISYEDYYVEYNVYGMTYVSESQVEASEFVVSLGTTEYTYDGTEKEPSVTVIYDGDENGSYRTLTNGTDYELTYSNNVNAGTAIVTITGISRFTDSVTEEFVINELDVSNAIIELDTTEYEYDGTAKKPGVTVSYNGIELTQGTDYTITYSNNINMGTATVTITGIGNCTGTCSTTFKIKGVDISESTIELDITEYTYDGTEKEPGVTVTYNGTTLVKGTDYSVEYSDNINAGTATVTITGIGNYSETCSTTFNITAVSISEALITVATTGCTYDGTAKEPEIVATFNGTTLVER